MKTKILQSTFTLILFSLLSTGFIQAETFMVKGKITDTHGNKVAVCIVLNKKSSVRSSSDFNGNYSISAAKGETLSFLAPGFEEKEIKVTQEIHNVVLQEKVLKENILLDMALESEACYSKKMYGEPRNSISTRNVIGSYHRPSPQFQNNEEYTSHSENNFKFVKDAPLSTFSIDVDGASYSNMRRFINRGELPPSDAVRTEEFINYFSYNYPKPTGNEPVKISAEAGECPWNKKHRLVKIAIKAREIANKDLPASNLVFLIDVSGSMNGPTRLDLVKSSLKLLINNLREKDRIAIVTYAGSAREALSSTSGDDKQKIREALDNLTAGGSTAGGAGIQMAYEIAGKNFIKNGNNRILLCTDGDFNVGVSSVSALENLIEEKRRSGVFLTVLGYGMGNYKDNKMQVLAEKGNGNHAYIDNLQEANKVLVNEFGGTLHTVAKDVKLQIEFNPEHVQAYRLIGYESRLLNDEDFNDDTKDAGEIGAGHTVTALYEVVPAGINLSGNIDPLKYQKTQSQKPTIFTGSSELLTVKLRYKDPDKDTSRKIELPLTDNKVNDVSSDFRFASAVAMFGLILSDSKYKGDSSFDRVISLAKSGLNYDDQGYRREFVRLVESAKGLK